MPEDAAAHVRLGLLGLRLRSLELLMLDQLLEVARRQTLDVIYHDVIGSGQGILFDDAAHVFMPALVALLLLDAVAEVVGAFLELELGGDLTLALRRVG